MGVYLMTKSQNVLINQNTIVLTIYRCKRRLLYLKTQSVPRCKHFSSRLIKTNQFMLWHKPLFILR
jgi:hypothetical protein